MKSLCPAHYRSGADLSCYCIETGLTCPHPTLYESCEHLQIYNSRVRQSNQIKVKGLRLTLTDERVLREGK